MDRSRVCNRRESSALKHSMSAPDWPSPSNLNETPPHLISAADALRAASWRVGGRRGRAAGRWRVRGNVPGATRLLSELTRSQRFPAAGPQCPSQLSQGSLDRTISQVAARRLDLLLVLCAGAPRVSSERCVSVTTPRSPRNRTASAREQKRPNLMRCVRRRAFRRFGHPLCLPLR